MKINNVEKAMPAKDGVSLRADIEKIRFDFLNDIANELKELYEKEKKKGQSFNDWLKSKPKEELEIDNVVVTTFVSKFNQKYCTKSTSTQY